MPKVQYAYHSNEDLDNLSAKLIGIGDDIREMKDTLAARGKNGVTVGNFDQLNRAIDYLESWVRKAHCATVGMQRDTGGRFGTKVGPPKPEDEK